MAKVFKDSPLAEITLRKYEPPSETSRRDLVKKLCLSLGLLQPGDSRDVVADVMYVILDSKKPLSSKEIEELVIKSRKDHSLVLNGIAGSNIRRQVKRLRDLFLIEKVRNEYRMMEKSKLINIFEDKIEKYYLQSISERVKDYCRVLDSRQ